MDKYTNLHVDLSYREYEILNGDEFNPDWKSVLITYIDNFMLVWNNIRWAQYNQLILMISRVFFLLLYK